MDMNVKAFSRLQEALGDVVDKEVDKAAAKVITEIDSSSKNWDVSPLSTIFNSLGFSAANAQTEMGSRMIAEAAREARRRDNWVLNWDIAAGLDISYVEIGCNCPDCQRERGKTDKSRQKAKDLLLSCLTQSQKDDFKNTESFIVVSPSGNKYKVKLGKSYNVVPLTKKGKEKSLKLCAGPKGLNPYDWVLAQKCLLEADEKEFLRVANKNIVSSPYDYWVGNENSLCDLF